MSYTRTLTKCDGCAEQQQGHIDLDRFVTHDLGELNVGEGQEEEDEAAGRDVIQGRHRVQLDTSFL